MTREEVTAQIVSAKVRKNIKWAEVAKKLGQSKEWATAACLGQMQMTAKQAEDLRKELEELEGPKRTSVVAAIKVAREFGATASTSSRLRSEIPYCWHKVLIRL